MTRFLNASLFTLALGAAAGVAHADQCAAMEKADGEKIFALLEKAGMVNGEVLSYCAPCGDTHVEKQGFRTKDLSFTKEEGDDFYLLKNGDEVVDAAYVYVPVNSGINPVGPKRAKRLSSLAGLSCELAGIDGPETITYDAAGKVMGN